MRARNPILRARLILEGCHSCFMLVLLGTSGFQGNEGVTIADQRVEVNQVFLTLDAPDSNSNYDSSKGDRETASGCSGDP
jgi:hypothetical protein